jgi:uncharacterized membrane protein
MGMPNWIKPVCATAVVVLAVASMLVALGHMSHSVWFDESQTHQYASQSTLGKMTALAMQDRSYPPLFFLAVRYSLLLRDDEVGLRLPAALFGALTVLAVFLLGLELADSLTGAVAAFLLVLTPGAFRYFVDGNSYTLLMLVSALSTLCLLRAARSDARRDWALYALCALAGLGTHPLFVLHLAAQILAGIYVRSQAQPRALKPYARLVMVAGLLGGAELAWRIFYAQSSGRVLPMDSSTLFEAGTLVAMAGLYAGPQSFGSTVQLLLWGAMQVLGVSVLCRAGRSRFWAMAVLIVVPLTAIPVLAKLTLPYVAYRYGLGIFPLACVVAAYSWKAWLRRPAARAGVVVVILVYWVSGAAFIASAAENTFGYQDWRAAASYVAARWVPGDAVLVPGDYGVLPFSYYWKGPPPLNAREAPAPRSWLLLSTFANENAMVARFTETRRPDPASRRQELVGELAARRLNVCQTAAFHRVDVLEVRRGSCEEAP